jgi:uncharacterized RDD family membrane protein YckC
MTIAADEPAEERSRENQAWARWLARGIDALLLQPALFLFFAGLGLAVEFDRLPEIVIAWAESPIWTGVISLVVFWALLSIWDPVFISSSGATPGKWMMGVKVLEADGRKLTFLRALQRTWLVLIFGQALRIPILSLIAMLVARAEIVASGATAWDKSMNCRVHHRTRPDALWLLLIVLVLGLNIGLTVLWRVLDEG